MSEEVKQLILSKMPRTEYREVMRCILSDFSYQKTAQICHYSVRQIERIVPMCWKEICILLAEDIVGKTITLHIDEATGKYIFEKLYKNGYLQKRVEI